ncbi:MAG: hypothetical protein ACK5KO_07855 [Arachnia sp.]
MAIPPLAELLDSLERLDDQRRIAMVVDLARAHRDHPGFGELLDGLSEVGGPYLRLVVIAARAGGDLPRLRELARHPWPWVRCAALDGLPAPDMDAAGFVGSYQNSPLYLRRHLVQRARQAGRADLIVALLDQVGEVDRAALLAFAPAEEAARLLPDLADLVPNLPALARRHPDLVLAQLRQRLADDQLAARAAWGWARSALAVLAELRAAELLVLLDQMGPDTGLPSALDRSIRHLGRADPDRLIRILSRGSRIPQTQRFGRGGATKFPKGLSHLVRALTPSQLAPFARRCAQRDATLAALLNALPVADREAVFEEAVQGRDGAAAWWDAVVLTTLPRELRHREARRMMTLPRASGTQVKLWLAGFLPSHEAEEIVHPSRHVNDAAERGAAWEARVLSVVRDKDPRELERMIEEFTQLRREQDPVRVAALRGLSVAGPALLSKVDPTGLEKFAESVVQARDTSSDALELFASIAWRRVEGAADRARLERDMALIVRLWGVNQYIHVPPLNLAKWRVQAIIDGLSGVMDTATEHEDFTLVLRIVDRLGRRACAHQKLQSLLEIAAYAAPDWLRNQAVERWLACPATRGERVAGLLAVDESFATLECVQAALCRSRQDLVEVCFLPRPIHGQLFTSPRRWVGLLPGPFTHWTPTQVTTYAEALRGAADDDDASVWARRDALARLARLPGVGATHVMRIIDEGDPVLRPTALQMLGHTDDPGASLTYLLSNATGEDARAAMEAAAHSARFVDPADAVGHLSDVVVDTAARVTAVKEALHILGRIGTAAALDTVLTAGLDPRRHKDVRVAAARSVLTHLDHETSWKLLQAHADSGDAELLWSLSRVSPQQLATGHRARYAGLLESAVGSVDDAILAALGSWGAWSPRLGARLCQQIEDPGLARSRAAAEAVATLARHDANWPVLVPAAQRLAAAATKDDQNAGATLDLPHRQRLLRLLEAIVPQGRVVEPAMRSRLLDVVDTLEGHADLADLAWDVRIAAVDWGDPTQALLAVAERIHPARSREGYELITRRLGSVYHAGQEALIGPAADTLIDRADAPSGTLALGLVATTAVHVGWTDYWRERLRRLREHPVAVVRSWARGVLTIEC